jgi:hypothetical protein
MVDNRVVTETENKDYRQFSNAMHKHMAQALYLPVHSAEPFALGSVAVDVAAGIEVAVVVVVVLVVLVVLAVLAVIAGIVIVVLGNDWVVVVVVVVVVVAVQTERTVGTMKIEKIADERTHRAHPMQGLLEDAEYCLSARYCRRWIAT